MTNFVTALKWVLMVTTLTSRACADDTHGIERRDTNGEPKKIVCYYTNWSVYRPGTAKFTPQNINPYLCTHLIYAFGGLDKENGLQPFDKYQDIELGGYAKFNGLKTYNKNLKTLLAIGGWNEGSARFSKLVADEDRRAAFVKNVVRFLRQYNFDGLDLDWEYPSFRDGSQPEDRENYSSLVKELREEFEKESSKTGKHRLLLTMAVPAGIEYIDKGYDVPKLNRYLDFLNILSYDYHSAYEPNANHHAPLYSQQEESEYNFDAQLTIDHTIKHYLKKGADPEKLVLGIPTYGRSYTLFNPDSTDIGAPADGPGQQGEATREKGYLAYYEICGNVGKDDWKVIQPKKGSLGPYAFHGTQWVGYDDVDIVREKAKFVNEKGLGGIMYWSIDNDDFRGKCHGKPYPLIEAGKEALLFSNSGSSNIVPSSTEEKRTKIGLRKNRPKHHTTHKPASTTSKSTTTSTTFNPLSTPEPPTTPDPGSDFICKEEGFFPHPRDCKKYFWCLDSGPSNLGIVAHQFTCPSGLLFNKVSDSCDYSRNVICNKKSEKSSTTTTTAKPTTASVVKVDSTTTTTTTTEAIPEEEYEDAQEDAESQEDPKAIKQLISLIKKLGGISELEKQLKLEDNSHEVTTPAISKTLYNKVFSGPTNNRFKNQQRNGPSGPQNEGLPPSVDVPYRKDRPQYVTIQRSRPLKNVPQDTEDSGTSNNKSVEPTKDDTIDYADNSEPEERSSTSRYSPSSPRSRSTTAESKSTSLRYVVLERSRPERTTTEEEELVQETPSSSTHRYITLLRHRHSTTTNEADDQSSSTTESSIRSTSKPSPRSDKEESTYADRSREKVSELEGTITTSTTTYAPTLPVTSDEYFTVVTQNTSTETPPATTNKPNTFLVFPQTVADNTFPTVTSTESTTLKQKEPQQSSTEALQQTSTEAYTTSIATTVITTVRESATEITRIPLRAYREYIKKHNPESNSQNDLQQNVVEAAKRRKNLRYSTHEPKVTSESTSTRRSFLSRKRVSYSPSSPIDVTKTAAIAETSTPNSRLFYRRHRNGTTTTTEPASEDDRNSAHQANYTEAVPRYRQGKFKPKQTTSSPDSSTDISSLFRYHRRQSTTERLLDTTPTPASNFSSRSTIRHFLRNRKTFFGEQTSTEQEPKSTYSSRSRFSKERGHRRPTSKEESSESTESVRFTRDPNESPTVQSTDQVPQSDSNEQVTGKTVTTPVTTPAPTTQPLVTVTTLANSQNMEIPKVKTEYYETTVLNIDTDEEARTTNAPFTSSSTARQISGPAQYLRIHSRNNSRFLKSPHETFENRRDSYVHSYHRQSPLTPVRITQGVNESKIEFDVQIRHENDIQDSPRTRSKVTEVSPQSFDGTRDLRPSRGRHRFLERTTVASRPTEARYSTSRYQSRDSYSGASNNAKDSTSDSRYRSRGFYSDTSNDAGSSESGYGSKGSYSGTSYSAGDTNLDSEYRSRGSYSDTSNDVTKRPPTRNRGSIKARNSLSRTEIKELVNLVKEPASKAERGHRHSRPINKIEETSFVGYDNTAANTILFANPGRGHLAERSFLASSDFDFEKLNSILDFQEPGDLGERDPVDYLYRTNLRTDLPNESTTDLFRVSETNNRNGKILDKSENRLEGAGGARSMEEVKEDSAEPPTRVRGNFRRNNPSMYARSRSTTSTSTTVAPVSEYTPSESSKIASRFRRRKIRPEHRSINTARSENFIPLSEVESSTVTRHKNNDGAPSHGPSHVSDYLPVPASLYRINQTIDQLQANNINSDEIEHPSSPATVEYYNDDISDLAHPAVAAISNLKTLPPASSPQPFIPKTDPPFTQQIIYNKEVPAASVDEFRIIKSTPRAITVPVFQQRVSRPRGSSKILTKVTSTTQPPSLQDIYNDYPDPELEYHADPVDIPISGKVRIHSDGYIECLDMGNFPHPFSCKKFISCAKMEYDSLLGWEYTCPKGLSFDPIGGICNWAAGLGCKE